MTVADSDGRPLLRPVYWIGPGPAPAPPPPSPPWPPLPAPGTESDPSAYDVSWSTPSVSGARGGFPLGSGECSATVWVEPNGDVLMYAVKSDSIDELTSRDKLARLRVRLHPPLTTAKDFRQRLVLRNASVVVESSTPQVQLVVFVDANSPALRVRATATHDFSLHASLEVWRSGPARAQGSFCESWNRSGDVLVTDEDAGSGAIAVAHANPDAVSEALISSTLKRQGIDMGGAPVYNPMRGVVFGAWVSGSGMRRVNATTLSSSEPGKEQSIVLSMLTTTAEHRATSAAAAVSRWSVEAKALAKANAARSFDNAAESHAEEWAALWERSWVHVTPNCSWCEREHHAAGPNSVVGNPSAVFALQRYLDLANGRQATYPVHGGGQAWGLDGCSGSPAGRTDPRCAENFTCKAGPANSGVCNPDHYQWWTCKRG